MSSKGDPGFTRVAIVNRGEAAVRLIRAVRELNLEHGSQIRTRVYERGTITQVQRVSS